MRPLVLRSRINALSSASSFLVLSALLVGCSTDFDRFSQSALPSNGQVASTTNPYPGDLDSTTTASVVRRPVPLSDVAATRSGVTSLNQGATPRALYHPPEPTFAASTPAPISGGNRYNPTKVTANPYAQPSYETTASVSTSSLPAAQPSTGVKAPATSNPSTASVKPGPRSFFERVFKRKSTPNQLESGPIAPVAEVQSTPSSSAPEWNSNGGTQYTVKPGETLYNLSKRFGVPVAAIQSANSMGSADGVNSGQTIVIPNYNYSESAGISAPDSDPKTRSARSSTGQIGEADVSKAVTPIKRPRQYAAVDASPQPEDGLKKRYVPKKHAAPPKGYTVPDHSIVTGGIDKKTITPGRSKPVVGGYSVVSGDSLSKIAAKSGMSVSQIKKINGLTDDSITVGQVLNLSTTSADLGRNSKEVLPAGVDPIVTGAIKKAPSVVVPTKKDSLETAYAKPEPAKETRTAALAGKANDAREFRWPVKGRIVTRFLEKDGNQKNDGIDISVPEGTAIRAAENGEVIYAGSDIKAYGNLILLRHTNGWVTAYAHSKSFDVKKGDQVRRGQIIARSGRSGLATKPKLHFEVRKHSTPVDPLKHLPTS